jgi:crotonobetainyl-CoA:carnitine CoA-transferase CaiB-like acyl-CoA transferase
MNPYFDDSATWSSRLAVRYPHAKYGEVEQVGTLWDFGELSTRLDRASPEIGQHSHEILGDLGFDDDAIASLIDSGAVTQLSR